MKTHARGRVLLRVVVAARNNVRLLAQVSVLEAAPLHVLEVVMKPVYLRVRVHAILLAVQLVPILVLMVVQLHARRIVLLYV